MILRYGKEYLTHTDRRMEKRKGTDAGLQEVEAFPSDGAYFLRK